MRYFTRPPHSCFSQNYQFNPKCWFSCQNRCLFPQIWKSPFNLDKLNLQMWTKSMLKKALGELGTSTEEAPQLAEVRKRRKLHRRDPKWSVGRMLSLNAKFFIRSCICPVMLDTSLSGFCDFGHSLVIYFRLFQWRTPTYTDGAITYLVLETIRYAPARYLGNSMLFFSIWGSVLFAFTVTRCCADGASVRMLFVTI